MKRTLLGSILLVVAMLSMSVACSEASEPVTYRVQPVYPPPLERPVLRPLPERLPQGAEGALPSFDGEPFHVNLPGTRAEALSDEEVRQVVDQVLGALRWERDPDELQLKQTIPLPAADQEFLEQEIERRLEETRKRLSGELGTLDESTEKALQELADEVREIGRRTQKVFVFEQRFEGLRLENSGVMARWREGRGLVAVNGRVFNEVRLENKMRLEAEEAIKVGAAHVARSTKVLPEPRPEPEPVVLPYGRAMRYAWRLDVSAEEGVYRLWLDAETGDVLQLEPLFWPDGGEGLVFDPDPDAGTDELGFAVNSPSGGQYQLRLTGDIDENNAGADGVTSTDLTIADAGTGSADFDVSPINGTVVRCVSDTDYNSRFQEVNAYAWVYQAVQGMELLGSESFCALTVTVNHSNPCGFGINNACASGCSITMGLGNGTLNCSTAFADLFNTAIDSTVLTHEFGHILSLRQVAVGGGSLTGAMSEGLADFWAATVHDTDTIAAWSGQNRGGPQQGGGLPRQAEPLDVFPEHRTFGTGSHADGQMVNWALWSTRTGLNNLSELGTLIINMDLLKALTTTGVGITTGGTDKRVHDSFVDLLQELAPEFSTTSSIHKVLAGFARAGILLSERDAVIDIDDDYLDSDSATGPTFTVWTGRDYQFTGETAVTANVFNTRFEVEVANDAAFTVNRVTSGVQAGVAVSAEGVPMATWTLPTADWSTLRTGDYLYYRVTTTNDTGGNSRTSTSPGNGFLTDVPPARAVINESGEQVCTCAASSSAAGGASVAWVMLVPLAVALAWRQRSKGQ